jgi:hypothetical protein
MTRALKYRSKRIYAQCDRTCSGGGSVGALVFYVYSEPCVCRYSAS